MLRGGEEFGKGALLLGEGTFSKVYRVRNEATGEYAACKVSSQAKLGEQEACLLRQLKHPLFPTYLEAGIIGEKHYLWMEYICGSTLEEYVEKRGGLSGGRALEIAARLAEGLDYLHERTDCTIYRDLKPENVMIQQDGRVRLVDLGCVYVEGRRGNGMAGNRRFAAPEQLEQGANVGRECDVYALGKLLEYMLRKENGGRLKRLIWQATRPEAKERIPDMKILLQRLENCMEKMTDDSRENRRRTGRKRENATFYYKKNIHRES